MAVQASSSSSAPQHITSYMVSLYGMWHQVYCTVGWGLYDCVVYVSKGNRSRSPPGRFFQQYKSQQRYAVAPSNVG